MKFQFNDGGREAAGYQGKTSDCVTRAIAIATGKPYQEVYDAINERATSERPNKRGKKSGARTGVFRKTYQKYLEELGFKWTPVMKIGSGCKMHLKAGEFPSDGIYIASLSRHLCAVIDGVIHDTHDPTRGGTRCVYGYYKLETGFELTTEEKIIQAAGNFYNYYLERGPHTLGNGKAFQFFMELQKIYRGMGKQS